MTQRTLIIVGLLATINFCLTRHQLLLRIYGQTTTTSDMDDEMASLMGWASAIKTRIRMGVEMGGFVHPRILLLS